MDSLINKNSRFLTILWKGYREYEMPNLYFMSRFKKLMIEIKTRKFINDIVKA